MHCNTVRPPSAFTILMNNNNQIFVYAVGGVVVLLLIYPIRDYVVIGLVSAGTVYFYKLAAGKNRH